MPLAFGTLFASSDAPKAPLQDSTAAKPVVAEKPKTPVPVKTAGNATKKKPSNFIRKKTDYLWIAAFFGVIVYAAETYFPERSNEADLAFLREATNPFGLESPLAIWSTWTATSVFAMFSMTAGLWFYMRWANPAATPTTFFKDQVPTILVNFVLLSSVQAAWDYASTVLGASKTTIGNTSLFEMIRDPLLWMLCFELAWYTQHRLMHDVKPLWVHGHSYHHSWKKPAHMIGITNFAFDHIVEVYVTMSSVILGFALFPINYYVGKVVSLAYMIFAVLVHWDGFSFSRYHINHHYLMTKNYGSHIPIFDMFFGTYQWDDYNHPESTRVVKASKSD